jgi:death-on-curing protein
VFLDLNDVAVADPDGRLYEAMIAIAERRMDKTALAGLLTTMAARNS